MKKNIVFLLILIVFISYNINCNGDLYEQLINSKVTDMQALDLDIITQI